MIWRGKDEVEFEKEIDETINEYFDSYDVQEVGRIPEVLIRKWPLKVTRIKSRSEGLL